MRTVTSAASQILSESDIAQEAMRQGILNLSAFAEQIQPRVEEITWKQVRKGTIVVALARLAAQQTTAPLRPSVAIDDLKIQSPLVDISFEKTVANSERLRTLQEKLRQSGRSILVVTEGMSELTIVASAEYAQAIQDHFGTTPKAIYENLAGVSVGFSPAYIAVPNALYTLLSTIASKRVNIIEIVSTYTELMVVVHQSELETCVKALQKHFRKK